MIIKTAPYEFQSYLEDSSNFKGGWAEKLFIPETEEEIFDVIKYCRETNTPLTISAAGTGTTAGRIPLGGVILSTEKLNKIKDIDPQKKQATLQCGVIIKDFLEEIKKYKLFYPPYPTETTATIGGNVATNASGEYSFRFGPTRNYVQRIKMILSSGDVLEIKRNQIFEKNGIIDFGMFKINLPSYRTPDVKCSAGYYSKDGMDAIDLIIGSEGTLGVITEVDVLLIESLPELFIMLIFFDENDILKVVKEIKRLTYKYNVYALEFFDKKSLRFVKEEYPFVKQTEYCLYIEAEKENFENWFQFFEKFSPEDIIVSQSYSDYKKLTELRHKLPENINTYFKKINLQKISVDAAVPEEKFDEFFSFYKKIMKENSTIEMILFGHIGENHLHFNMFPKNEQEKKVCDKIYIESVKKAVELKGTGFAEHGIGKIKNKYIELMFGKDGVLEMVKIKKTFDPYCILNLDNIFPKEYLLF